MIMTRSMTMILLALWLPGAAVPALAADFQLDPAHSSIQFQVRHLGISKVRGEFTDFDASFSYEPGKPASWQAEATIQATSIDTQNEQRDTHLRSPDFFDVAEYPTITFKSTGIEMTGENTARLKGNLTIRGVTKPVVLDLETSGTIVDPWGNTRAGFSASGTINRQDFGLTWNKVLETGGLVVGNDVGIAIEIEGILRK
jgi:polyisoprenoid-binding protein YceI